MEVPRETPPQGRTAGAESGHVCGPRTLLRDFWGRPLHLLPEAQEGRYKGQPCSPQGQMGALSWGTLGVLSPSRLC